MSSIKLLRRTACVLMLWTVGAVSVLGDGLPGEYVLTQRWRNMITDRSPLTNPALMTEENYLSVRGALAPILEGQFLLFDAGMTIPIGLYQSAGWEFVGELDGKIQEGRIGPDGKLALTGENVTNANGMFLLAYAIHFWNRLSAGANVKTAVQTLYGLTKNYTVMLDVGLTYRLLRHSVFGDHVIGLSTQNILPILGFKHSEDYSRDLKFN